MANLAFVHPAKRHFESRTTSRQGTLFACWVRDSFTGWFERFCLGMREGSEGIDVIDDPLENISMER